MTTSPSSADSWTNVSLFTGRSARFSNRRDLILLSSAAAFFGRRAEKNGPARRWSLNSASQLSFLCIKRARQKDGSALDFVILPDRIEDVEDAAVGKGTSRMKRIGWYRHDHAGQ